MKKLFLLAFAALAAGASAKTLVIPHVLEKSGLILDVVYDVTGGQTTFVRGADGTARQHHYINLKRPWVGDSSVVDMAVWAFNNGPRQTIPLDGHRMSPGNGGGGGGGAIRFATSTVTEMSFPDISVNDVDPPFLGVTFDADSVDFTGFSPPSKEEKDAVNADQKKWLPSNFRIDIGNLPTSRISKIDAFTIKQVADLDGDGAPDLVMTDLVVTMPADDAMKVLPWLVDTTENELSFPFRFTMFAANGNPIRVSGLCGPYQCDPQDVFLGPPSFNPGPWVVKFHVSTGGARGVKIAVDPAGNPWVLK